MHIRLDNLKIHQSWHLAPLGSILKVTLPGKTPATSVTIFGMRCEAQTPLFLVLDGPDVGALLYNRLRTASAIDVSDLYEIVIKDPAAINASGRAHQKGFAYVSGQELICMAETEDNVMWVKLNGPDFGTVLSGSMVQTEVGRLALVLKPSLVITEGAGST